MNRSEVPFRSLSRDDRRHRILWAAKLVFFERGFDETSMDDVAAAAGTTKPTVYAHFKSKEELFSAVLQFLRDLFRDQMGSPDQFADEPLEGIARFCGRIIELISWQDRLGFHRLVIASTARSPEIGAEVYNALFGSAIQALAVYLERNELARNPEDDAERILAATVGMYMLRYLYGVGVKDLPKESPGEHTAELPVDLRKIRETVAVFLIR
jgi:AcrR family transcriptional regulator